MNVKKSKNNYKSSRPERPAATALIERLKRFDGPADQFLLNLLAVQCALAQAGAGVILHKSPERGVSVLAVHPPLEKDATAPVWLARSAEFVEKSDFLNATTIIPLREPYELYGQGAKRHLVLVPLNMANIGQSVAAFVLETGDKNVLDASRERLELTANLLTLYEMRVRLDKKNIDLKRLRTAMDVLSAVNRQSRFAAAVMSLCNELAAKFQCERVTVGFLKGRYVQLKGMSHTENFSRKMKIVQDLESVMEECLDQDIEVIYPCSQEAAYVSRAAVELSRQYGPLNVLSLPLRKNGQPVAVMTLERPADKPFNLDEIETARLLAELCTTRVVSLYENDRWVGAKAAAAARKAMALVLGAKHTWAKVTAVLILAAVMFLIFAKGLFRVEAPFVLEATRQQFAPAPFDGFIKTVGVSVGDSVEQNKTVMAQLETAELKWQLAQAKADRAGYLTQASAASRDGDPAKAQIAQANAQEVEAQIDLLEYRIAQASIIAPMTGTVVEGDLEREIGAPVKTGDVLFKVASLESLRAELMVPEDRIADIRLAQAGFLATASYPARKIDFVVERINPMAEVVSQRNVFKVRVRLGTIYPWMRPGMEGVARVSVEKRSYAWIWTRKLVNWIRMKFWL